MFYNLLAEGDAAPQEGGSPLMTIMLIVLIVAIVGLFIWQSVSGKKKQKEAQERVNALKKGDRVKTIGGICGFVAEINDAENTFVLETGTDDNKSFVKFDKAAIYQTAPAEGYANAPANAPETKTEAPAEESKPEESAAAEEAPAAEEVTAEATEEKAEVKEETPAAEKKTNKKKKNS